MAINSGEPPASSARPGQSVQNHLQNKFSWSAFVKGVLIGAIANSLALIMIVASNSFFTVISPVYDDRVLTSAEQMAQKVQLYKKEYIEKSCQDIISDIENKLMPGLVKYKRYDYLKEVKSISACLQSQGYDADYYEDSNFFRHPSGVEIDLSSIWKDP